jgi:hypothetical protein
MSQQGVSKDEIIKVVKNTGNIGQLENLMKTMMKK